MIDFDKALIAISYQKKDNEIQLQLETAITHGEEQKKMPLDMVLNFLAQTHYEYSKLLQKQNEEKTSTEEGGLLEVESAPAAIEKNEEIEEVKEILVPTSSAVH